MKLSQSQLLMLRVSGRDEATGQGRSVRLMSARNWHTAYSLERKGLGRIEDNRLTGKNAASYFFANEAGAAIIYPEEGRETEERKLAA
ncbi:hypothetical protein NTCA1_38670 [Novosphingobium sp. TCA1]|nr:hypothetical protein NTCA1_38670 [Novosphingobium sp. TCA1]